MKDQPINQSKKPLLSLLRRYHLVMFIVAITLMLSVSILLLYSVVNKASGENSIPDSGVSSNFDQATIDRINELKTSDQPSEPLDFSGGRINPFSE